MQDTLAQLSDALVARAAVAQGFVIGIRGTQFQPRSGTLWRTDVAVASEQVVPKTEEAEIVLADGRVARARVAGRDRGTNIVAFRLQQPVEVELPAAVEPRLGAFALVFGADGGGTIVRMGVVRALGPAWHSLGGGRIDHRISLDLTISSVEEGGPVLDASGGLLGMSTAGPRGRALVIPAATIERVLTPLLTAGRVERGWLGLALHPVALPEAITAEGGRGRGLMVMRVSRDGPAGKAGVLAGDILVSVGGTPTGHPGDVARQLGPESVGQAIELHLIRSGSVLTLTAMVTAHPAR